MTSLTLCFCFFDACILHKTDGHHVAVFLFSNEDVYIMWYKNIRDTLTYYLKCHSFTLTTFI